MFHHNTRLPARPMFIKNVEGYYVRLDHIERVWICGSAFGEAPSFVVTANMQPTENGEMYEDLASFNDEASAIKWMERFVNEINQSE